MALEDAAEKLFVDFPFVRERWQVIVAILNRAVSSDTKMPEYREARRKFINAFPVLRAKLQAEEKRIGDANPKLKIPKWKGLGLRGKVKRAAAPPQTKSARRRARESASERCRPATANQIKQLIESGVPVDLARRLDIARAAQSLRALQLKKMSANKKKMGLSFVQRRQLEHEPREATEIETRKLKAKSTGPYDNGRK